jgi:hypothetical protein
MKQPLAIERAGESQVEPPAVSENSGSILKSASFTRAALLAFIWVLAVYQFSETTVDPDLWGHVAFGQQMLKTRAVERADIYSWTVNGTPFINHEYGADIILGATHKLLGGSGILLLKVVIGLLTFGLALRLGTTSLSWPASAIAFVLGAVAVTEISFGFAARPQIFTALGLAIELILLRRIHNGQNLWAIALPLLFIIWINIHGGALAGVGLLGLAAGSTTLEFLWSRIRQSSAVSSFGGAATACDPVAETKIRIGTVMALWLATLSVLASLCCNPWGPALVRWLIQSVFWFRPEIEEWNPTPFGWDHAALFILIAVSVFAWAASRRPRKLWELAVCGAFALLALRSVRNTPLFAIIALAFVPPHLVDALARFRNHFEGLLEIWHQRGVQNLATRLLGMASIAIIIAAFTLHKDHPLTMEVPRSRYPTAAINFIRDYHLQGKMLNFFDWGDMIIFQLPNCAPSIDGRLDASYPRSLITAHWKLYNGEPVDEKILPIDEADLALLPSNLAGTLALRNRPGWRVVYFDDTAALLARDVKRFSGLVDVRLPVQGAKEAALGRAPFPDVNPRSK